MLRIFALLLLAVLLAPVPGEAAAFVDGERVHAPRLQTAAEPAETPSRVCARAARAKIAAACPFSSLAGAAADGPALPVPAEFACRAHLPPAAMPPPPCGASPPERPPRPA